MICKYYTITKYCNICILGLMIAQFFLKGLSFNLLIHLDLSFKETIVTRLKRMRNGRYYFHFNGNR